MSDIPYVKYKFMDLDVLDFIQRAFREAKENNSIGRNYGNVHHQWFLQIPMSKREIPLDQEVSSLWDDNIEMFNRLEKLTYPFDEPIINSWIKYYKEGEFGALHQDDPKYMDHAKNVEKTWTNSILIDEDMNASGGEIVFSGDKLDYTKEGLRKRLEVDRHNGIGEVMVWNDEVVHGIGKMKRGYRASLIVIKERKNSQLLENFEDPNG